MNKNVPPSASLSCCPTRQCLLHFGNVMVHNRTFSRMHRLDFVNFDLVDFFIDWISFFMLEYDYYNVCGLTHENENL
jgi:hypothetical protein